MDIEQPISYRKPSATQLGKGSSGENPPDFRCLNL